MLINHFQKYNCIFINHLLEKDNLLLYIFSLVIYHHWLPWVLKNVKSLPIHLCIYKPWNETMLYISFESWWLRVKNKNIQKYFLHWFLFCFILIYEACMIWGTLWQTQQNTKIHRFLQIQFKNTLSTLADFCTLIFICSELSLNLKK